MASPAGMRPSLRLSDGRRKSGLRTIGLTPTVSRSQNSGRRGILGSRETPLCGGRFRDRSRR
eukprot:6227678-Pyramimonas_sp.AAC.1